LVFAPVVCLALAASTTRGAEGATAPSRQIEQRLAEAAAATDPNVRNALLDAAAAEMEQLAADLDKPDAPPEQRLEFFRLRLHQAEATGRIRGQPYLLRLRYLQGTDDDREAMRPIADDALRLLGTLSTQTEGTLAEWRADYRNLATVAGELEDLQEDLRGEQAWVTFCRAMASNDGQDRTRMLQRAIALAGSLIREGRSATAKPGLFLLRGMAEREAGQFEQASADLLAAADPNARPSLRAEALFELARNLIEQGRSVAAQPGASADKLAQAEKNFDQAANAIEAFDKVAAPGDRTNTVHADVKRALLLRCLCSARAACRSDTALAAAEGAKADEAVLSFLTKYTDIQVQRAFLAVIARDFRGREDHRNLDSLALLALAGGEPTRAPDDRRALLETILARKDQLSSRLHPLALWHLAFQAADAKDDAAAGKLFGDLAERFPRGALSPAAAVNAAISFSRALAAWAGAGEPVPADLRRQFVGALESLLRREDCTAEGRKWRFELGWQYEKLAERADAKDGASLEAKAIATYEAVPSDAEQFMQARYRGLELSYRRLPPRSDEAAWRQAASALATRLMAYAADAAAVAKKPPIAVSTNALLGWGGQAEFRAADLLYNLPGRREEAMAILRGLPGRWPGTPVVAEGAEFEIRKLLDQGRTGQAAKRVEAFSRDHPDQGRRLIQLVVAQIRRRIELLRAEAGTTDRSTDLRRDFLSLAGAIYGPLADRPVDQRYDVTQMYGEALVENGRAAEAVPLLLQCADYAEAAMRRRRDVADRQCRENLAALKAAAGDAAQLRSSAKAYLGALAELGMRAEDSRHGQAVKAALEALSGSEAVRQSERLASLARALEEGYPALRDMQKASVPGDAANMAALARAYRALGRHAEAVRYYRSLVDGLGGGSTAYWSAELEYCQCLLEGFASDRQAMKGLVIRLKQLRMEDLSMGGLKDRFEAVESRARELAG
jgi:hypothetical protein